jgi:hypothetical protein
MTHESMIQQDWRNIVERLGGAQAIAAQAKQTRAFLRARELSDAIELLRLILAYCLSHGGLRSTAAWAAATGLADISNVALLYRLRQCGDWLAQLIGQALAKAQPEASRGRPIRLVDATTVPKAGGMARRHNRLWRIHSGFEVPAERFGFFELTDEHGGERLDRLAILPGEIRIADRAHLQPERIAKLVHAGADLIVRAGWKSAGWRDAHGKPVALAAKLSKTKKTILDLPIWLARKKAAPLGLRLVAVRKPKPAAKAGQAKAKRQACRGQHRIAPETLIAAEWVILVTSLPEHRFTAADILALYRLRWRIELAFKRLKSLIGLHGPPGQDERSARPYILAHLLIILLLEPLAGEFDDSPRLAA